MRLLRCLSMGRSWMGLFLWSMCTVRSTAPSWLWGRPHPRRRPHLRARTLHRLPRLLSPAIRERMQEKQAVQTGIEAVISSSSGNTLMRAEGAAKSGAGFVVDSIASSMSSSNKSSMAAALMVGLALSSGAGCNRGHSADVMATVNSHAIMKAELDKQYAAQLGDAPQQQQPTHEQAESLRLNVLRELIDEEIVQQRAAKMNLTATNEEVDAKLAEMKAPYTEEQFDQRLKASNHTLDDVKHDLRRSVTIDKLLNKEINSKITVTDTDVKNYYTQHKAEYNLIETQYHLAQIQVTSVPSQH